VKFKKLRWDQFVLKGVLVKKILSPVSLATVFGVSLLSSQGALAEGDIPQAVSIKEFHFMVGNLWLLVASAMVFMMHLGFATIESGFSQSKNTVNVLFKNVSIVAIGLVTYYLVGFNLMYPGENFAGGFFGFGGFFIGTDAAGVTPEYNAHYTYWTDFIFQAMFAATAATIVSGAVAERIKLKSFLVFSTLLVALAYPIVGMWHWGGGFLKTLETPFHDFAGSTLVHSVGGWAALVLAFILGPRLGKYVGDQVNTIPPHSIPLATMGMFLLWFGWFGFNGGSVLSADPGAVSLVFVTTALGAAGGIIGSMLATQIKLRNFDLGMVLNGALAGLVGITAGADKFSPGEAIIVGLIGGALVVYAVLFIDRALKIDDPVGAISVHLVCGIWGTLAVGIFGELASPAQFVSQLIGVASVGAFVVAFSVGVALLIRATMGLRVDEATEVDGLDHHEHEASAYRGVHIAWNRRASDRMVYPPQPEKKTGS
jgi:Amt family ammonium transporter